MNIGGAYPESAGIVSLFRECSLTEDGITVADDVKLKEEGRIAFHLTSATCPEVISEGKIRLADERIMTFDPSLALDIEKIENKNEYEDINVKSLWGVDNLYRITLSVTAKEFKSVITIA